MKFLGVPFADQPIRFAQSKLKTEFDQDYDATNFGPRCFGARENLNKLASEDCLNLNIYTTRNVLEGKVSCTRTYHEKTLYNLIMQLGNSLILGLALKSL